jgi:hypothetical protein
MVMHSATKYLNGHSDMVGGVLVVGENRDLEEKMTFLQNAVGGVQGPFDSFLALRGLKTLHLRMERTAPTRGESRSAPGGARKDREGDLSGAQVHPQHALAAQQMHGFGGMSDLRPGGLKRRAASWSAARSVRAGRVARRRREPDQPPGDHDPRLDPAENARGARHPRPPGAAQRGRRGRRRPARRPGAGLGMR